MELFNFSDSHRVLTAPRRILLGRERLAHCLVCHDERHVNGHQSKLMG